MTVLRFACRTGFATPTKSRHTAGVPAAQTLRSDVIFTCAPIGAAEGVARRLAGLPAAADAVMRLLSQQKWDDGEVTERSPPRNKSGCVEVQKVYFRCGGGPRQSFTSPTTFNKFLDCVNALEPDTTVDLLLWDVSTSTAPSTPEKGEMNCLCMFLVLVVHASRCACFSGCMLPCNCLMCLSLLRTGHSHTCTCIHWRFPNSSMPTGLCVSHHRSCLTGAGRGGAGGGAGAAAGRLTDGSSVHESCKNGFETLMPATYLLRASARTQPSSNTCVTDYTLGAPHCLANLHAGTWRPTHLHATHHVHVAHVRLWMFDCKHNIILPPEERLASVRADLRAPEQRQLLQVFHTDNVEEVFHVVLQSNSEPLLVDGQPVVATDVTARRPDILVDALQRGVEWTVPGEQPGDRTVAPTVVDLLDPTHAKHPRAIIAPSGAGKSATVLQVLTKQFGCYMEMPKAGATFVTAVGDSLEQLVGEDRNAFCSRARARTIFRAAHVAMLLVLEAFVEHTEGNCTPLQWTNIMLTASNDNMKHYAPMNIMFEHVFRETKQLGYDALHAALGSLRATLNCPLLCVDEAQRFLDTDTYGKYKGPTGSERSVFTCLLDCPGLVLLGTGLRLEEVAEAMGSSDGMNAEGASPRTQRSIDGRSGGGGRGGGMGSAVKAGIHNHREDNKRLARRTIARKQLLTVTGCDCEGARTFAKVYGLSRGREWPGWHKLVGRARLTAKFVLRLLLHASTSDDWDQHLEVVFDNFATDIAGRMAQRVNLDARVHRTTAHLPPVSYQQIAIDLLQDIIWRNGFVTRASHEVVEFIDHGICMLVKDTEDSDLRAVVREPLAREALLLLCDDMGWDVCLLGLAAHMTSPFTSRQELGRDFERLLAMAVVMKALAPREKSSFGGGDGDEYADGKSAGGGRDVDELADGGGEGCGGGGSGGGVGGEGGASRNSARRTVFSSLVGEGPAAWPQWRGPRRFHIVDCRNTDGGPTSLADFLEAAVAGKLPKDQGPVFCFPEENAGPDLVTLLQLRGGQLVLWSLQAKLLSERLGGEKLKHAVGTTMWTSFYNSSKAGPRIKENREKVREIGNEHFAAKSLSTLCVIPGITQPHGSKGSDQQRAETLVTPRPHGNTFVLLDSDALRNVMSHACFQLVDKAANDAAVNAAAAAVRRLNFNDNN